MPILKSLKFNYILLFVSRNQLRNLAEEGLSVKMEDLDGMIMKSLKHIGCAFCKDIDSISLMGVDDIFEGIIRLLWLCDNSTKQRIHDFKLPSQMTLRYKKATYITDAVKILGIREKIGYHTILYPNLYDVRNIFIFLIEKLPKNSVIEELTLSPKANLKTSISTKISCDMSKEWIPGYCWRLRMKKDDIPWLDKDEDKPFTLPILHKSAKRSAWMKFMLTPSNRLYTLENAEIKNSLQCLPKLRTIATLQMPRNDNKPTAVQINDRFQIITRNRGELKREDDRCKALLDQQFTLQKAFNDLKSIWDPRNDKLIKTLLNPEMQIVILQKFLSEGEGRQMELEENFINWKRENMPVLEALKLEAGLYAEFKMQELFVANQKLDDFIANQKKTLSKVKKQLGKGNNDEIWDRNKFLSRIIYLANNVNGQKAEIASSLVQCKRLEKEKSSLLGSLDRTFMVINNWLYQSSESDLRLKNSHDIVMKFHTQCCSVMKNMDEMYEMIRQKDIFDDEIEILKQQNAESNLDQILRDLIAIQKENCKIEQKLIAI